MSGDARFPGYVLGARLALAAGGSSSGSDVAGDRTYDDLDGASTSPIAFSRTAT